MSKVWRHRELAVCVGDKKSRHESGSRGMDWCLGGSLAWETRGAFASNTYKETALDLSLIKARIYTGYVRLVQRTR